MSETHNITPIWFADPDATDHARVGGKGANLGRLTGAGFVVPPGFVVPTDSYNAHIEKLKGQISELLASVDYNDADQLDKVVEKIRKIITDGEMPTTVSSEIIAAYQRLGDIYVAVRSSGTAEDLEGASFAGLHDTYLDIKGNADVIDAVKRCWASLWTARAVSYRKSQGFTAFPAIAIVVQTMVESEVSGVMFTGNPINTATDELMINASWGLGEAVVSGIVTPDEYIVSHRNLKVLQKTLGTKKVEIVRDPSKGSGTLHRDVEEKRAKKFTLNDTKAGELAEIGRRIQAYYDGMPQDIEWGYAGGQFYMLQSRPVTSVEFSWDADVTESVQGNSDAVPYDNIWSRVFPEEMWTGAISPLMFSWRCWGLNQCHSVGVHVAGYPEQDYTTRRLWRYYKGVSYYNVEADRHRIKQSIPPQLRPGMLHKIPKAWHEEVMNADFDWGRYIEFFLRTETLRPDMGFNWPKAIKEDFIESPTYREATRPRTEEERRAMSDDELKAHLAEVIRLEISSYDPPWYGLLWYMGESLGWIGWITQNWYTGGRPAIFMDLMTGTRKECITGIESHALWDLANDIYKSPELLELFRKYPDERFFDFIGQCVDGPKFKKKYEKHVRERGHRGHPDRDIYFDRRADSVMVDLRMFPGLFGTPDPRIHELKTRQRLEETIQHVYDNLAGQPEYGIFKAKLFKFLIDFSHNAIEYRDNEREVMDWSTYDIKICFEEVGRRCVERGGLKEMKEAYFLTMEELYAVLAGTENKRLTRAKIDARRKNFDAMNTKSKHPAAFIVADRPAPIDQPELSGDGVLKGKTTSTGKVTGTARVVFELSQIGKVKPGDILIVHATDPGWTPVFMLIKGIVLETGGLISHGALLAREFGLPGVQIEGALQLIPDGATITLDGDSGAVIIHPDDDTPTEADSDLEAAA
ncbi:PEP/pyruvate-binding domain-containing protein [Polycyclovorans algicola]|uniref:PEP/pyruvate-binding domain-containing protein n=1 Tax=Polycyclovorans algicola TaxID=616992 RepID=UPI001377951E|nr:PEP/pyruvate-binding domain-containing protein [Polycyclovorans algicola]